MTEGITLDKVISTASVLVLAIGNDIMGDDGAAFHACRILNDRKWKDVDFVETIESGLALLEIMSPYDQVLLLDTITTGKHKPGDIVEFSYEDFTEIVGPSPHYLSLPDVILLAEKLSMNFPKKIRILAMEIDQPSDFSEKLSNTIQQKMPTYVKRASEILRQR